MLHKQSFIFAFASGAIGLCALLMFHKIQSDGIEAQKYHREFNQMTVQINSLSESLNSLTKLTLQLDKSLKQIKAESAAQSSAQNDETLNQGQAVVTDENVTVRSRDDSRALESALSGPALFQAEKQDGFAVTDDWQIRQQENLLISSFEHHFSSQGTDANWAQSTEQSIKQALADDIFSSSRYSSISCRATLCKIDAQHGNIDSELVFLEQINSRAGFRNTESFYTRDVNADGTIVMTFYISRDGHRLPRFSTTGEIMPG